MGRLTRKTKTILIITIITTSIFCVTFFSYFKFSTFGIEIDSDSDFKRYMCPGKGTEADPYRIENRKIKPSNTKTGIYIYHTSKHFVIQNCIIDGGGYGIQIRYIASDTGKILNCTIKNTRFRGAINIKYADGIDIINNEFISNEMVGEIQSSNNVSFSDNFLLNNHIGLAISSRLDYGCMENIVIENNIFINTTWVGIYFGENKHISLRGNNFLNSSIGFDTYVIQRRDYYETYIIEDNFIDNKPVGMFTSQDDLMFTSEFGQLFLFDCSNLTFVNQNFKTVYRAIYAYNCYNLTIIDSMFDASFPEYERDGLYLSMCTNFVLNNVTFIEGEYSFYYGASSYVDIQNCYFINQTEYCIYLENPGGGIIANNYFSFENSVIMIKGSLYMLTIENNTIVTY